MENIRLIKVCKTIIQTDGRRTDIDLGCILCEKDTDEELINLLITKKFGLFASGGIFYRESSIDEVKISDLSISEYILLNQAMKGVI